MSGNELVLRLAGEGGEGVISAGDIFAAGAAHLGHYLYTFRTYPAEIKGGHAWIQGRVSNRPVLSMGDHLDVLVAFDAEAYHRHHQLLKDGGVLVYDPDTVTPENGEFVTYAVPFNKIARKELDFLRGKNLVVLGVMSYLFGLKIDALESVVRKRLGRRSELLDQNLKALEYGFDYAKANLEKKDSHSISGGDGKQRLVMSGSDAIVAGALYAGCRFFAGYPITPASDIMESMARELPRLGGGFVQAEDEIAALGAAVGASYAGAKAMTATSGPGLSLMTEFLGLAGMAEIPVVVVDAQRAGPATGMPTKLEQGDLNHALYGGHGDFPRVVIASASVEDALYQTIAAFNMAERFQVPVIFLSDQSLSYRTESIDWPDVSKIAVENRLTVDGETSEGYARYALTETGISPTAIPGHEGTMHTAPGLEHDEYGHPRWEPELHTAMMEKRARKLEIAERELGPVPRYGVNDPKLGIISWGSTEGPIREAIDTATAEGYKVAALHPRVLHPLPRKQLEEFISSVQHVLVPELNYSGQFAQYLAATFGFKPIRLNKYGGVPFAAGEIYQKIIEVLS